MSITQITIGIKNYYPSKFSYDNFVFHFISEKIKLSKTIPYNSFKKITHKFDLKIDTTYYIKAMVEGEIVGIANFSIPANILFKKVKLLNIPNIKFTMTDYHKKRFFHNKDKDTTIELDIEIRLTHLPKQLAFKKIPRRNPCELRIINSDRKRNRPSINTPCRTALHSATNIGGYIHYKKAIDEHDSPQKYRVRSAQQSANTSINIIPSNSNESNAISIVDSILIDNEYNVEETQDNDNIYPDVYVCEVLPSDADICNGILLQKEKFLNMNNHFNKKLMKLYEEHCKLLRACNRYHDKRRELDKKNDKLNQWKGSFDIKNKVTLNINRNDNEYINKLFDIKSKENEILDVIFSNVLEKNKGGCFQSKNIKKDVKISKRKENPNDKEFLLNVLKKTLNINVDLNICFNLDGISKFREICHKYQLIEENKISNGLYYNNQIKEEEENELE